MAILIVDRNRRGRLGQTRSEQCQNIRRVYGGSGGLSDEKLDKMKFVERKLKEKYGKAPPFIPAASIG